MDPSAQNFLVNLFNSNKVDDSDQNKTFNPNGQPLMPPQNPGSQNQLPFPFNFNQGFTASPQTSNLNFTAPQISNINKEMSQSILSILQKKEPEKTEATTSLPSTENVVSPSMINQNATLSSNTEELKKLLQINTTVDNNKSNNISITSAPTVQEDKKNMEPAKSNDKPKVQSNPNTPLFDYVNPFTTISGNKTERSDSEYEIVEIQDLNNDEAIISSQIKKESESNDNKSENKETYSYSPLKNDIVFNLDSSLENAKPAKEIITVAKIKRNIEKIPGKEIAVNNKYICYSSKNKNIRVIHQESGDLRLFKGHEQRIIDTVVFISKSQNKSSLKAASIDEDNTLILWTEDNNKELKKLLVVKGIDNGSNRFQRVLFHPFNENIVAVSTNTNNILLFDLRKYKETIINEVKSLEDENDVQCFSYDSEINDFRFSSDGSVVVAGYEDGHVRFYDINSGSNIHDFVPHNGEPISSVMFANAKNHSLDLFLVTASKQNNEIRLWSINDMSLIQTIHLRHTSNKPEFDFNTLEYNGQHQILVMSNVSRLSIMFSHVKGLESVNYPEPDAYEKNIINNNEDGVDISNVEFEEIKEFKIEDPVMNYIIDPNIDPLFNNEDENISLYCISSEEIYQYVINMNDNHNNNDSLMETSTVEEKKKIMENNEKPTEESISTNSTKEKTSLPPESSASDLLYILTASQKDSSKKNNSNELLKLIKEGSSSSVKSSPKPTQDTSGISTPLSSHSTINSESNNGGAADIFQTISDLNNTNNLLKIFESNTEMKKMTSPKVSEAGNNSNTVSPIEIKTNSSNPDISKEELTSEQPLNITQNQFHNELKKIEANLTLKMNEMLAKQNKHYEKLLIYEKKKRIEAEQRNREIITKTIRDDIRHISSDAVERAVSREIKNNVIPMLNNTINQGINQQLNKQVENAITKNIRRISEKVSQSISKPPLNENFKESISEIVKPVISDTVKEVFNNYILNDFQKTINFLILQVNETVQNEISKNIKNEYMNNMANRNNDLDQIFKQISSINAQLQTIQQQNAIQQQSMTMKTTPERATSYSMKTPTVHPAAYVSTTLGASPMNMNFRKSGSDKNLAGMRNDSYDINAVPTTVTSTTTNSISNGRKSDEFDHADIDRLIKEEKFEEIFTNILKANNEEELKYVCSQLNPNKLLIDSGNSYLSQIVIIALINQLSNNLSLNATWRIEWLRCSFLVLNANDEYIKAICPNILKEASEKMINFTNEVKKIQPQSKFIDDMNTLVGAILYTLNNINNKQ
ncbi:WD40 repeat-like protein [Anaeromyces robustus]|uniref:WD40 repeat-like protein n=1 Tax=Anaeromyces robustus TaxID=1754192 RepID=A0A1Y1X9D4_9FUNG|nr:WD40 repeat-like protein [Anaeromyces robustus]|eukprot:ORX82347.1 WD40 repeat-like protein [Anaeromyces robustus]